MYLQNEAAINKEKFELGLKEGQQKEKIEIARKLILRNKSIEEISSPELRQKKGLIKKFASEDVLKSWINFKNKEMNNELDK